MTAEILAATEHLVLRRMTNDDAAALAAYRSDPVQARYQSWETPYPLDSAQALIAQMRNVDPDQLASTRRSSVSSPNRSAQQETPARSRPWSASLR
jgi:aminoglycoside 6'-N-acetyltransferase